MNPSGRAPILIAGVSTRAAAESAALAGHAVTAIDAFGDLDQHPSVHSVAVEGRFTPDRAAQVAKDLECAAVVYLANFENHPRAIAALADGRALWGNPPECIRRVRDPQSVSRALQAGRFPAADVRLRPDAATSTDPRPWLVKPLASGGGQRIRLWNRAAIPNRCYLQEFVEGPSCSVVFVAAGGRAVPLGVSHQLIGDQAFGALGYQYCGSLLGGDRLSPGRDSEIPVEAACALADEVTARFGLVGVNGIDFIVRAGKPYAVEVNPRWCASMELVERAYDVSVFGAHAAACADSVLPKFDLLHARRGAGTVGKAVVFATEDVTLGDTRIWFNGPVADRAENIRDIPRPGSRIPAGHPICTVFSHGRDAITCHDALVRLAGRVRAQVAAWSRL